MVVTDPVDRNAFKPRALPATVFGPSERVTGGYIVYKDGSLREVANVSTTDLSPEELVYVRGHIKEWDTPEAPMRPPSPETWDATVISDGDRPVPGLEARDQPPEDLRAEERREEPRERPEELIGGGDGIGGGDEIGGGDGVLEVGENQDFVGDQPPRPTAFRSTFTRLAPVAEDSEAPSGMGMAQRPPEPNQERSRRTRACRAMYPHAFLAMSEPSTAHATQGTGESVGSTAISGEVADLLDFSDDDEYAVTSYPDLDHNAIELVDREVEGEPLEPLEEDTITGEVQVDEDIDDFDPQPTITTPPPNTT